MYMKNTFRAGLLLALLTANSISGRADSGATDRSNAFGYEFTQEELDSFPQKTNLPTVYLQIYKTDYDAETDKTSLGLTWDGKPQFANIWDIFGDKHDWYYISKIVIRDDYGTIKERNEWLGVRGRGNSTWYNEGSRNKPLRLKFNKKADLLTRHDEQANEVNDYATDKNWTLLANHYDATRIRNALAIELEKRMGMTFVPACKFVDLVVMASDGNQGKYYYMGTYQISDHVNVADRRVPIDKKTGYFLEGNVKDTWGRFQEDPYIEVPFGDNTLMVNVKNPDPDVATPSGPSTDTKYNAIKEKLAMVAQLLYDGDSSWRKYVDLKSAVDAFVLTEIVANYDGAYANNYCYLNNIDGKIVFGPVWDLDLTFNYNLEKQIKDQHFWQFQATPFAKLCEKAYNDQFFMKAVYERFKELQDGGLNEFLQTKATELKESISQSLEYNFANENWQGDRNIGGAGNTLKMKETGAHWADENDYKDLDAAYAVMNDFIPNRTSFVAETFLAQYNALDCEHAVCTDHDYADCTFAQQTDGTYRRVCNICSEAETEGEAYYYFTVYPESSITESFYATSWQPGETVPNAIATVEVDASALPMGYNIVNARKDAAGNKTCAELRLTDGHPFYSDDKFVATTATYSRSVSNAWGTMILPFDLQQAENETARFFHLGEVATDDQGKQTLVMTAIDPAETDNAVGYTPVFFMSKDNAEQVEVTAENVTVKKVGKKSIWENSTVEGWTLTGVMQKTLFNVNDEAYAANDFYYIKSNEFWHATGSLTTNPFRAYLSTAKDPAGARSLRIALANEASDVKELAVDNCLAIFGGQGELTVMAPRTMDITVSTLGGVVVRKAALKAGERLNVQTDKGVYIVNGVKVIVK